MFSAVLNRVNNMSFILFLYFSFLPQNTANNDKKDSYTKANESGEEVQKETGLPQSKK